MNKFKRPLERFLLPVRGLLTGAARHVWGRVVPLIAGSPVLIRDGVCVHVIAITRDIPLLAGQVKGALALIEARAPWAYRRLKRSVTGVIVVPMKGLGRGSHVDGGRWVYLDEAHVRRSTAAARGATLVHEATHAHVFAKGIPYRGELRDRIEAICARAAKDFLAVASTTSS
jgi:hypothetical protein